MPYDRPMKLYALVPLLRWRRAVVESFEDAVAAELNKVLAWVPPGK